MEALRAAERRHAEARIRATFDDIKQKAFLDVTQRIHRSSSRMDTGSAHRGTLGSARSGMQPLGNTIHQRTQPLQHFVSDASVSQIVDDLRVNSGMQRNTSLDLSRQPSNTRPPKGRHLPTSSLSSDSSLHWTNRADHGQGMQKVGLPSRSVTASPNNLMRLTSCVKLSVSR